MCWPSHASPDAPLPQADWGVGEFSLVSKDGRLRDRYSFAPRARNEHGADWVWERLRCPWGVGWGFGRDVAQSQAAPTMCCGFPGQPP